MEPTNPILNPTLVNEDATNVPEAEPEKAPIIDMEANDEDFLMQLLNIDYDEEQYNFTQEQVETILTRLFEALERLAEEKFTKSEQRDGGEREKKAFVDAEIGHMIFRTAFDLFSPRRRKLDKENIQDQVVKAATSIALRGEHLGACYHILNHNVLQNVQMIRPEVLFECSRDLNWYDQLDYAPNQQGGITHVRGALSGWMSYDANFNPNKFINFAEKSIANDKSFENIVKNMMLVRKIFEGLMNEGYSYEKSLDSLQNIISMVWQENDNYLIRAIAEQNIGEMSRGEDYQNDAMITGWVNRQNCDGPKLQGVMNIDLAPDEIGLYDYHGNLHGVVGMGQEKVEKLHSIPILGDKNKLQEAANIKEFTLLLSLPMRNVIENDFGIDLAELDFSIQYYFLNFLKTRTDAEARELAKFTQKFGVDGFKTFLSLDTGAEMSEKIFAIDKNLPEEASRKVFAKYGEIVDAAETLRDHITTAYSDKEGYSPEQSENVIQNLLSRGKELLTKFSAKSDTDQVIDELEQEHVAIIAFGEMFSELKGSCELKDFAGINIESKRAQDIGEEEQKQMADVLKGNWGHEEYSTIYPMLEKGMKMSLEKNSPWSYHFVKYNLPNTEKEQDIAMFMRSNTEKEQDIAMFMRFRPLEHEGYEYMAGVNVHPNGRGKRIGEAGMKTIIDSEAAKSKLIASVYAKHDIASHYVKNGFVVSGVYRDFHETGEPYLCIVRDDEAKGYFWPKKSKEEVITSADQAQNGDHFVVKVQNSDRYQVHDAEIDEETKNSDLKYCETLEPYFHQGFVCSALYKDGKDWYFAMEKNRSAEDVYVEGDEYKIERRDQMDEAA